MRVARVLLGGVVCAALMSAPVRAGYLADLDMPADGGCAVSAVNGKLEGAGGVVDTNDADILRYRVSASITAPLGCDFGLQFDGNAGDLAEVDTFGGALHLFTRDPASHLAGLYAEYNAIGSNDVLRLGAEGEYYLDRVTISAIGGYEDSDRTRADGFGGIRLSWYLTDNLQINGGGVHFLNVTSATLGLEWQPEESWISLFTDAAAGSASGGRDHLSLYAGIRLHFGPAKTLIRRHREDDPFNWMPVLETVVERSTPRTPPVCPPGGCPGPK